MSASVLIHLEAHDRVSHVLCAVAGELLPFIRARMVLQLPLVSRTWRAVFVPQEIARHVNTVTQALLMVHGPAHLRMIFTRDQRSAVILAGLAVGRGQPGRWEYDVLARHLSSVVPAELLADASFVKRALEQHQPVETTLQFELAGLVDAGLLQDREIALRTVLVRGSFERIAEEFQADRDFVFAWLQQVQPTFYEVSNCCCVITVQDVDVCLDEVCASFLTDELKCDRKVCLELLPKLHNYGGYGTTALWADAEFVGDLLRRPSVDGSEVLMEAAYELTDDPVLALLAVQATPRAMLLVSERLRADGEFLASIQAHGRGQLGGDLLL